MTTRLWLWLRSWWISYRAYPPFSQKRRDLLGRLGDMRDPSMWVEVERPTAKDGS
jgi:hypothetical protein